MIKSPVYAITTALVDDLPLEEALRALAEAGFTQVEISGKDAVMQAWLADPAALAGALRRFGIVPRSIHTPGAGWDNAAPQEEIRLASVAVGLTTIEQAAALGAELVIVHANKPNGDFTPEGVGASWARSRASLVALAEHAGRFGVKLALENLPARGTPRPTAKMEQVLALIDGLGDHVGVCLDAGHSNANGLSAADDARIAGAKLWALHIQDNDGLGEDQHWIPGQGTTDWAAFLRALDEIGFTGLLTFEVLHGAELPVILRELVRLRQAWGGR
ncbi:MAG: sugar phosphate isomerase/epimerase [Chloroflexota bacterium]